jgi:hypothetical protein
MDPPMIERNRLPLDMSSASDTTSALGLAM